MDVFEQIPPFSTSKQILESAAMSLSPLPLLAGDKLQRYFHDVHARLSTIIPPLGVYSFENATVGPVGLALNFERKYYYSPDLYGHNFLRHSVEKSVAAQSPNNGFFRAYSGLSEPIIIEGNAPIVVVNKAGNLVYGHWLIDILPSLWFFITNRHKHGIDPAKSFYLLPAHCPSWGLSMFNQLFGIDEKQIIYYNDSVDTIKAKNIILTSLLRYNDCASPLLSKFYDQVVLTVASPPSPTIPKRFFISRRDVKSTMQREVQNSQALETIAQAKGLEIVDPAQMPWSDQIRLFADAELIVGPFGSGLHNTIFSSANAISLSLGSSKMNWLQSGISALRQQRMAYLMPSAERVDGDNLLIEYDSNHFSEILDILIDAVDSIDSVC